MQELNIQDACDKLNKIMKAELAGVVRYTHYALMVTGPYRLPIVEFMQAQAAESLTHAQQAGTTVMHCLAAVCTRLTWLRVLSLATALRAMRHSTPANRAIQSTHAPLTPTAPLPQGPQVVSPTALLPGAVLAK